MWFLQRPLMQPQPFGTLCSLNISNLGKEHTLQLDGLLKVKLLLGKNTHEPHNSWVHCQIKIASIYAKKKWFKKGSFIDVPSMEKCIAQVTNNAQKNLAKTVFLKFLIA